MGQTAACASQSWWNDYCDVACLSDWHTGSSGALTGRGVTRISSRVVAEGLASLVQPGGHPGPLIGWPRAAAPEQTHSTLLHFRA